jgi:regulator of sigma E protease
MVTAIWFVVSFIIALGILVFVHELGHFLVAKRAGIRVERFSLGFPPKAIGFQWGETEYCLSWIPFGGYVKVAGMADVGTEETSGEPWEFPSKPIWVRMAVIVAGPIMNFIFAFVAFLALFLFFGIDTYDTTVVVPEKDSVSARAGLEKGDRILRVGDSDVFNSHDLLQALTAATENGAFVDVERKGRGQTVELPPLPSGENYGLRIELLPKVGDVRSGMPAETIGLQEGDRIVSVAGTRVSSWQEMSTEIRRYPEQEIELKWERSGLLMSSRITPIARQDGGDTIGQIGIGVHVVSLEVPLGESLVWAMDKLFSDSLMIVGFLAELFKGDRSTDELGGPLRIAQFAGENAERGAKEFISFLAVLSVHLGILNLLPIPVLDGGHLAFLTLEGIMRRPLSLRKREVFQQVGLLLLLVIMVLVTFNDLNQMVFPHIVDLFQ